MNLTQSISVTDFASRVDGRVLRGEGVLISGIANLESAGLGDITYSKDQQLTAKAINSNASCLVVPVGSNSREEIRAQAIVEVSNPRLAIALIAKVLYPAVRRDPFIHPTSVISSRAKLDPTVIVGPYVCIGDETTVGANTRIEAGVVIGNNVEIGQSCVFYPEVVLYDDVVIGNRVIFHAGVCIGADGFGYARDDAGYHKFPHLSTVIIEDDVELGSYTCVDRGALSSTRIGRGSKLDNLVHVGHNCEIGERVVIAAQTGISGSVVIEDDVIIGGQVGIGDHVRIQSGVVIGSKAGILPHNILRLPAEVKSEKDRKWWGIPVRRFKEYEKLDYNFKKLPRMREELKALQERMKDLEEKLAQDEKQKSAQSTS